MAKYDYRTQRLFVRNRLFAGGHVDADRGQANYLLNVLRMKEGAPLLLFNGTDGEWLARVEPTGRKACTLVLEEQTRAQTIQPDLHYFFAPLKHARLDYMMQKAVEMGAGTLVPVITQHTQTSRINAERMEANLIEAAEQCGVISVPKLAPTTSLADLMARWPETYGTRRLVFCDERAEGDPLTQLAELTAEKPERLGLLIGPEGGFSPEERDHLLAMPATHRISLGPRILRADTAAVAGLAILQMVLGDWRV